ncbi:CD4-2 molecule, tandem duplicate 2 [Nematolebias whitei]|uniref:CD4-2 molecule, tandem duplicate 2 n=1 Tax=Nematolebias whitei TaxID=451745 RepID=UPI001896AB99|nr:CD4-2 molecule, tandem duplicate 2 [Nematolebias whitei]
MFYSTVLAELFATGNSVITEVGQKITLKCGVDRLERRVEWSHGSDLIIRVDLKSGTPSKGKSHIKDKSRLIGDKDLVIFNVEERDAGKFTCKTDGRSSEQALTVVSVSVDPHNSLQVGSTATLQCRVKELDQTLRVEWQKPDGSVESSNIVHLNPVDMSHGGNWHCRVVNNEDQFSKTLSITVTGGTYRPPAEAGELMLLGLIWWVWVAFGVGSLLVIILIVVVIFTVMRIRKKKRRLKMKQAMLLKPKKYCQCARQTAAPKPWQGRRREKPPALPLQPLLKE